MTISHHLLSVIITLFFMVILQPLPSYSCTPQRVLEARSALSRSISPEFNPQDLTTNHLCLVETLFLRYRYARGSVRDLQGTLHIIVRHNGDISDLQARLIQSLIETASPSNDIHEARMIQDILSGYTEVTYYDWSQRPSRKIIEHREFYFSPEAIELALSVIERAGPSNDIHEAKMIYNILAGSRDWGYYNLSRRSIEVLERRPFSFSPEKTGFIDFVLERATDDNHYRDADVIYLLLERDLNEQDLRNVQLAFLTAGRDWANGGYSRFSRYGGFGRTSVIRAMTDPAASRQRKDLMALVVALEHPENGVAEGPLLRRIANIRWGKVSQEEYQCTVNALHAYMAPGQERKPPQIVDNLWRMISNGACLGDPYFDRSYFINYDLETTLNEALLTIEIGREVNFPHQCVGDPCP